MAGREVCRAQIATLDAQACAGTFMLLAGLASALHLLAQQKFSLISSAGGLN